MLGHELRNPLAPIVTAAPADASCAARPRSAREQEVIERQVEHMMRLVDDLLDVSRVARGKIELSKAAGRVCATLVAKAVEIASPLLEQRQPSASRSTLPRRSHLASKRTSRACAQVLDEPA